MKAKKAGVCIASCAFRLSFAGIAVAICEIEGAISEIEGAICEIEGAISEIEGAICEIEGAISQIAGANARLEGAISQIKGAISQIKGASRKIAGAIARLAHAIAERAGTTAKVKVPMLSPPLRDRPVVLCVPVFSRSLLSVLRSLFSALCSPPTHPHIVSRTTTCSTIAAYKPANRSSSRMPQPCGLLCRPLAGQGLMMSKRRNSRNAPASVRPA
jgi:prefoldin subunit 5